MRARRWIAWRGASLDGPIAPLERWIPHPLQARARRGAARRQRPVALDARVRRASRHAARVSARFVRNVAQAAQRMAGDTLRFAQ
jgi:hypothetical protein